MSRSYKSSIKLHKKRSESGGVVQVLELVQELAPLEAVSSDCGREESAETESGSVQPVGSEEEEEAEESRVEESCMSARKATLLSEDQKLRSARNVVIVLSDDED